MVSVFKESFATGRYLSLRDLVNPKWSLSEVLSAIDCLNFSRPGKKQLVRLAKILLAGTQDEERTILSNTVAEDPDFAQFLQSEIFSVEILPIIYGRFLQDLLSGMDDRTIAYGYREASPTVQAVIRRSISKNRFRHLEKEAQNPADAVSTKNDSLSESFLQEIQASLFQNFSRKLTYPKGKALYYTLADDNEIPDVPFTSHSPRSKSHYEEKKILTCDPAQFYQSSDCLEYLGRDNLHIYWKTKEYLSTVRFEILKTMGERESLEFSSLLSATVIPLPYPQPQSREIVGGGYSPKVGFFELIFLPSGWDLSRFSFSLC